MKPSYIEALESRITPSTLGPIDIFVDASTVVVTLAAGVLKIAPAVGITAVEVSIEQLSDGSILIADNVGDSDLETTANFHGTVKGINVALGATGDDKVTVDLDPAYNLSGNVSISTGLGDDLIDVHSGSIRGNLTIAAKGAADVTLGGAASDLFVRGIVSSTTAGGNFILGDTAKTGTLNVNGASDTVLGGTVAGTATLTAKVGNSSYFVGSASGATIGGSLKITGVVGNEDVFIGNAQVRGALTIGLGAGNNQVELTTAATIRGIAGITATLGNDTVLFSGAGPDIHGRTTVSLGEGTNVFDAGSGILSAGLAYTGGSGVDTVTLGAGLTMFGDVAITAGNGANTVKIATFSSLTKFTFTGGLNVDTITLASVGAGFVNGSLSMGDGADLITVLGTGDFFNTFKSDGGLASDTITIDAAILADGWLRTNIEVTI